MNKFYGQFNPPIDQVLYERYFRNYARKHTFLECGAADGISESSCKFFEETMGWSGINIEPNPYLYEKCQRNRPNCLNLNIALSSTAGIATFTNAIHPELGRDFGNGSLSHSKKHLEELAQSACKFERILVKTSTFRDIVHAWGIKTVDLMVLDVEGHELQVLEGMQGSPVLPTVLCIEHGQLGIEALTHPLKSLGYSFDTESFVNSVWLLNADPA